MKHLLFMLLVTVNFAQADSIPFDQYQVPVESIECKKLDFTSYFQAEKSKPNILKVNPDLTHPNFAGNLLLVKVELLMESLWLLADCKTGKFFHEKLSGRVSFKPDSRLIALSANNKNDTEVEYQSWDGETWVKVDIVTTSPAPTAPSEALAKKEASTTSFAPTASSYDVLFAKYPSEKKIGTCKAPDFSSYFKAMEGKSNILKLNSKLDEPNFNGHYLILKNNLMFDTLWLTLDCDTGKFLPFYLSGDIAQFKIDSSFLLIKESKDFPRLFRFSDQAWIELQNLVQKNRQKIKNTITHEDANRIFELFPNPDKLKVLRFSQLICKSRKCTVKVEGKDRELGQDESAKLIPFLEKWGFQTEGSEQSFKIDSGRCSKERQINFCDIESETADTH